MTSEIKVDTISEQTSANGVTIDGLTIKDGNIQGSPALVGTTPSFTIGDGGAEDTKIVFDGNALDYYIGLDDSADNLIIGSGSTVGSNSLITIDSDGDLTLDITGAIILDADDEGTINFKDGGSRYGLVKKASDNFEIQSMLSDGDIVFKGNDGGATITALTLDMSLGGSATFNHDIQMPDNGLLRMGAGGDLILTSDGTNGTIFANEGNLTLDSAADIILDSDAANWRFKDGGTSILEIGKPSGAVSLYSAVSDADILFKGNDGGSAITALTLDMSAAGHATFNNQITSGSHIIIPATSRLYLDGSGDTFISEVAANAIAFTTGNTERMRIDSSGRIGIGTATLDTNAQVQIEGAEEYFVIKHAAQMGIKLYGDDTNVLYSYDKSGNSFTGGITFNHADGTTIFMTGGGNERMRIASDGDVFIGATANYDGEALRVNKNGTNNIASFTSSNNGGHGQITIQNSFRDSNSTDEFATLQFGLGDGNAGFRAYKVSDTMSASNRDIGLQFLVQRDNAMAVKFQIADNGDLTAADQTIGSLSDVRLKKDIADLTYSIDTFKALKPRTFNWKNPWLHGGETNRRGFIAQELKEIDPYWINEQKAVKKPDDVLEPATYYVGDVLYTEKDQEVIDGNKNVGDVKVAGDVLPDGKEVGDIKTEATYTYQYKKGDGSDFDLLNDGSDLDNKELIAKLGKKDAMYISVIQQLITRIEALEG